MFLVSHHLEGAFSWQANMQLPVALSTTAAEYIAMIEAMKEAIWLKGISKELDNV